MATQLFVDIMAEQQQTEVDGESACGNAYSWKDRKSNIALITGITGQVNKLIDSSCHNRYCSVCVVYVVQRYHWS